MEKFAKGTLILLCYGTNTTIVVFDGYISGPNTMDAIYLKRTQGIVVTKVTFIEKRLLGQRRNHFWLKIKINKTLLK